MATTVSGEAGAGLTRDAVVVGSGPNGLAAAIVLAKAGLSVVVREMAPELGGGLRSQALTRPGFVHDVCAAIMPLAATSPFLRSLSLEQYGVRWVEPSFALAHPFDNEPPAILEHSLESTVLRMGGDGKKYRALMQPLVDSFDRLLDDALAPLHVPRHPVLLARFGWRVTRSAAHLARATFERPSARALFTAIAAHAVVSPDDLPSAAYALILAASAHKVGWPLVAGGSQNLAKALATCLRSLGGEIELNSTVRSLNELQSARIVMLDLTPPQMLAISDGKFPRRYARALARYKFGPGVFKVDWALREPVPWTSVECRRAGVLHLGGSVEELSESERDTWRGRHPERPFVILAQPSLFDDTRAPRGAHTLWAYCHVPNGSDVDMTERIESQIERFAPGFRDVIIERHSMSPSAIQAHDENLIGGEIGGGQNSLRQLFFRPAMRAVPYSTPLEGVYICSASTPPGGAVHGMCGYHAAHAALSDLRKRD